MWHGGAATRSVAQGRLRAVMDACRGMRSRPVVRVRGQPNDVGLTICSINVDVSLLLAAEAGLIAALIIKGSISCSASQRRDG